MFHIILNLQDTIFGADGTIGSLYVDGLMTIERVKKTVKEKISSFLNKHPVINRVVGIICTPFITLWTMTMSIINAYNIGVATIANCLCPIELDKTWTMLLNTAIQLVLDFALSTLICHHLARVHISYY